MMGIVSHSLRLEALPFKRLARTFLRSLPLYFLWAISFAQSPTVQPPFELSDFSGGLNTRARSDKLAPNEALILTNWLLNTDGALTVRPGYAKVNASQISGKPIWGLYHYSLPTVGKGFLVGDSNYIYKMTDAGVFADSQIYSSVILTIASGSSQATVVEPQDKWLVEKTIFQNDEIRIRGTGGEETLTVDYTVYNVDTSRYIVFFSSASNRNVTNTSSGQTSFARLRAATIPDYGRSVQRNNTIIASANGHQAVLWDGLIRSGVGFYAQGIANTVEGMGGLGRDTSIVCNSCNFSANELVGKILVTYFKNTVGGGSHRRGMRLIANNTATRISWAAPVDTQQHEIVAGMPFTVWSPVFTPIANGIIDSVFQQTGAQAATTSILDNEANFTETVHGSRVVEFLTGPARGILKICRLTPGATDLRFYEKDGKAFADEDRPRKGDKYAVYDIGLSARFIELYYDRLIAAGLDFFPNTIIYSAASNINGFSPGTDFLTLPEQGGDSIVAVVNFNGALRALQKQRLWTLLGQPPWTGSTVILSADGIGCVASRSVVQDGNYLYFGGFFGDIPSVYRWDGGGVKFSTTGGSAIVEGEGHLVRLTAKIDPTMKTIPKTVWPKATSAIYGENLLVSTSLSGSSTNDATITINLRTGAISIQSFEGGLFHNGRAAGDSGQVYFTHPGNEGTIYEFGKDSTDLGTAIVPIYESGWLDLGSPQMNKQALRLWTRFARANATGTGTWSTRWDFSETDAGTFNISTSTGERDENTYLGYGHFGKRVKFRFIGNPGFNATFRLGGVSAETVLRGKGL